MIEAIITLWLLGSISEQDYISKLACEVPNRPSNPEFSVDADFVWVYADGSSVELIRFTDDVIVRDQDNNIVFETNIKDLSGEQPTGYHE